MSEAFYEEKDILAWSIEAEKAVRRSLLLFYAYLFADLDDYLITGPSGNPSDELPVEDIGATLNIDEFLLHKQRLNETRAIQQFLQTFVRSQILQKFCRCIIGRKCIGKCHQYDDDFWILQYEMKKNRETTLRLVQLKAIMNLVFETETYVPTHEIHCVHTTEWDVHGTLVCEEVFRSDCFLVVMRNILCHLKSKDVLKISRALSSLHILLLSGPESVLSVSMDMLGVTRYFLYYTSSYSLSSGDTFRGYSHTNQRIIYESKSILHLLLDLQRLKEQRKWLVLWRHGAYPHKRYKSKKINRISALTKEFPVSLRILQEIILPCSLSNWINYKIGTFFTAERMCL